MRRAAADIQDELLVFRCQDGETDALGELVSRWHPKLLAHAYRLTGSRDDAMEAVQEAWLAIVRSVRRLDDPARFRPWAYRIVTNKAVDKVRRAKKQRRMMNAVAQVSDEEQAEPALDQADEIEALRAAVARLTGDRRAILTMFYLESMQLVDIAEALGVPVGTVKSRLHNARARLKQELEKTDTPSERKSHVRL